MRYFILLFLLISLTVRSQDFAWFRTINGADFSMGDRIKTDNEGAVYFRTHTAFKTIWNGDFYHQDAVYSDSAFIVKYNSAGVFQWIKRFGQILDFDIVSDKLYIVMPSGLIICDKQGTIINTIPSGNPRMVKALDNGFYLNDGEYLRRYSSAGALMYSKHYPNAAPGHIFSVASNSLFMIGDYSCNSVVDGHQLDTNCNVGVYNGAHYLSTDTLGNVSFICKTIGGYKTSLMDVAMNAQSQYMTASCLAYDNTILRAYSSTHQEIWSKELLPTAFHITRVPAIQAWDGALYAAVNSQHYGHDSCRMQLRRFIGNGIAQGTSTDFIDLRAEHLLVNEHGIYITGQIMHTTTVDGSSYTPSSSDGTKFVAKVNATTTGLLDHQALVQAAAHPNPFTSSTKIVINSANGSVKRFDLFSMQGNKMTCDYDISGDALIIRRGSLPAGLYLYKIALNDGSQATGKLIAE